jgi:2-dehydropantoate 2-reductase
VHAAVHVRGFGRISIRHRKGPGQATAPLCRDEELQYQKGMDTPSRKPVSTGILGAGSVGCYIGGRLAAAGANPVLVGRAEMVDRLAGGLTVSDYRGNEADIGPDRFGLSTDIGALAACGIVLVCVKSRDTMAAASDLAAVAGADTLVISCQNGVSNSGILRGCLSASMVLSAMVGFNVAQVGKNRFHCGTNGEMLIEADSRAEPLFRSLDRAGIDCGLRSDIEAVMWGKLILNLNNSVNALSGKPLRQQLLTREYRQVLAAAIREALLVLDTAGIAPAKIGPAGPRLIPKILQLPDSLFGIAAAGMLKVDAQARSSMAEDLERGRPTEIDQLNGEIVALAGKSGIAAPINARLAELVRTASESPGTPSFSGPQLLEEIRIASSRRR